MTRALVLGGGGVAGIAWETGLLLGLLDAGIDVTGADLFIGTSAGSAVAAQLTTGVALEVLFDRQVSSDLLEREIAIEVDAETMMAKFALIMSSAQPGVEMNKTLGAYALGASTVPEAVRRDVVAARLPVHEWPARDLRIVTVDAVSGEPRVFTAADGVDLVDAVAGSCAVPGVWPPVTIGDACYIDGGIRSASNADLAAGCDCVLVLAPLPELPIVAPDIVRHLAELRTKARVVSIGPDDASAAAMGANPLDPATARPSALAGRAQAAAHVGAVSDLWRSGE